MVAVINSSINLFQQGLRFEKNQTEDDMDKVRQKYCELASRELSSSWLEHGVWGREMELSLQTPPPPTHPPCSESKTSFLARL